MGPACSPRTPVMGGGAQFPKGKSEHRSRGGGCLLVTAAGDLTSLPLVFTAKVKACKAVQPNHTGLVYSTRRQWPVGGGHPGTRGGAGPALDDPHFQALQSALWFPHLALGLPKGSYEREERPRAGVPGAWVQAREEARFSWC